MDVEPGEAQLLIELIETLFQNWYIERNESQERNAALKAFAEKKKPSEKGHLQTPPRFDVIRVRVPPICYDLRHDSLGKTEQRVQSRQIRRHGGFRHCDKEIVSDSL